MPKEDAWDAATLAPRRRGQPAAGQRGQSPTGSTTTSPRPATSRSSPQDPQDPARLRVRATDTGSGHPVRRDRGPPRRRGRLAPAADRGHRLRPERLLDDETLAEGHVLPARPRRRRGRPRAVQRPLARRQPRHAQAPDPARQPPRRRSPRPPHLPARQDPRAPRAPALPSPTRDQAAAARRPRGAPARPPDRQPSARRRAPAVEVWRQLDGAGDWKRIATATTSKTGRFSYKARRGPARTIRFRYPGTSMIRGRNADVRLRVKASTSIAVKPPHRDQRRVRHLPRAPARRLDPRRRRARRAPGPRPRRAGAPSPNRAPTPPPAAGRYRYRFETVRGARTLHVSARGSAASAASRSRPATRARSASASAAYEPSTATVPLPAGMLRAGVRSPIRSLRP